MSQKEKSTKVATKVEGPEELAKAFHPRSVEQGLLTFLPITTK
jgi:hypothetical protein